MSQKVQLIQKSIGTIYLPPAGQLKTGQSQSGQLNSGQLNAGQLQISGHCCWLTIQPSRNIIMLTSIHTTTELFLKKVVTTTKRFQKHTSFEELVQNLVGQQCC